MNADLLKLHSASCPRYIVDARFNAARCGERELKRI